MKTRPILFSAPMMRALLDGSKTQTRRVCKPAATLSEVVGIQDPRDFGQSPLQIASSGWFGDAEGDVQFACPYGQPGDRLWVREAFRTEESYDHIKPSLLVALDGKNLCVPYWRAADLSCDDFSRALDGLRPGKCRPGMFMPRAASRITLEITGVRVERLQDISAADAFDEGIKITVDAATKEPLMRLTGKFPPATYIEGNGLVIAEYASLWECINGAGSWASNPWVWVVIFKRIGENK